MLCGVLTELEKLRDYRRYLFLLLDVWNMPALGDKVKICARFGHQLVEHKRILRRKNGILLPPDDAGRLLYIVQVAANIVER